MQVSNQDYTQYINSLPSHERPLNREGLVMRIIKRI